MMKTNLIATWVRTVVLALALVNQALVLAGWSPLPWSNDEIEHAMTALFTAGASLWAWWRNNSVTKEARHADVYMRTLKTDKLKDEGANDAQDLR